MPSHPSHFLFLSMAYGSDIMDTNNKFEFYGFWGIFVRLQRLSESERARPPARTRNAINDCLGKRNGRCKMNEMGFILLFTFHY